MIYTVYILFSVARDKFYIGYTGDEIAERMRKHNSYHTGFTGRTGDWSIVYKEIYSEKSSAMKREKEIKSWKSKERIQKLIKA